MSTHFYYSQASYKPVEIMKINTMMCREIGHNYKMIMKEINTQKKAITVTDALKIYSAHHPTGTL